MTGTTALQTAATPQPTCTSAPGNPNAPMTGGAAPQAEATHLLTGSVVSKPPPPRT